ncbi:MAG: MFS transporter [Roseiflexaceae bacterium]|nr:MFS transporter [Roseiflexaceae bacterium]
MAINANMANWKVRFFLIWGGQALSLFGSSLAGFGLIWWLTQSTGSATVLAFGTIMTMIPGVLIGPFAGALVDRWDRRVVMITADSVGALAAATLAVLFWSGSIQLWHIYTIMFIRSLAGAFHFPAMQASTSLLVPEQQLTRVAGMNQMLQGASSIVAPPLGALLVGLLPLPGMMAIDVFTALIAVGTMSLVHIPRPERIGELGTVLQDVRAGLSYIWNWAGLRAILILATVLNLLLVPAFSLLPILVTRHFVGGPFQLASMEAAMGIGMIAGGVLLGVWGGFKRRILTTIMGAAGLGIGAFMVGLAPAYLFPLALAGMGVMGAMSSIANGSLFAIVQSIVAPEMQGRVFTVMGSIAMSLSPIGLAIAGPLSDRFGVQTWYITGAIACMIILVVCLITPAIMQLEDGRGQPLAERTTEHATGHI